MNKITGCILWEGKSLLDLKTPIVAIATWGSRNSKTGDMIQTWIMRQDIAPHHAQKQGLDGAICGDCRLRPIHKSKGQNTCYVRTYNAPRSVWEKYKRGGYPVNHKLTLKDSIPNIPVRLGAYGDPVAVPLVIWQQLISIHNQKHTGYTHQWRLSQAQPYRSLLMASVDCVSEFNLARSYVWRCFFVNHLPDVSRKLPLMAQCPASAESKQDKTCADCGACNGVANGMIGRRASIVINQH